MKTEAWATVGNLGVIVNTVADTRRGAIVNYLYTYEREIITNSWTDQDIEAAWANRQVQGVIVTQVDVVPREGYCRMRTWKDRRQFKDGGYAEMSYKVPDKKSVAVFAFLGEEKMDGSSEIDLEEVMNSLGWYRREK